MSDTPTTKAGRRLDGWLKAIALGEMPPPYETAAPAILAIEAEAILAARLTEAVEGVRLVAGLPWPPTCADCGMATEDPDAYHGDDEEMMPEGTLCQTGTFHRWRDFRAAVLATIREAGA